MIFIDILCVIALIIWLIRDEYVYKGKEAGNGCLVMLALPVIIPIGFLLYAKVADSLFAPIIHIDSDAEYAIVAILFGVIIPLAIFPGSIFLIQFIRNRRRKK